MKRVTLTETELRRMIQLLIKESKGTHLNELTEPFQNAQSQDIIKNLQTLSSELDKVAFSDDEKFDSAFEEITAAHTAIERLLSKLNVKTTAKPKPAVKMPSVHAESRKRKR